MATREALAKLNSKQLASLKSLKEIYKVHEYDTRYREACRGRVFAYTQALCDSDVITEAERKALFIYFTL